MTVKPSLNIPDTDDIADADKPQGRRRAPSIVIEKVDSTPSYGEDPGPDGTQGMKDAYERRKMDAKPDEVRLVTDDDKPKGRRRAPTIVLDAVDLTPSYGEDPGPDGSEERKKAWERRKMDATPDEIHVVRDDGYFAKK